MGGPIGGCGRAVGQHGLPLRVSRMNLKTTKSRSTLLQVERFQHCPWFTGSVNIIAEPNIAPGLEAWVLIWSAVVTTFIPPPPRPALRLVICKIHHFRYKISRF